MKARLMSLEDIRVGDHAFLEHTILVEDVDAFASVSGDHNPLHTDDTYAHGSEFGQRIVHGMFLGALLSRLIGMQLPGQQALLLKESLEFKHPAHIGDTVRVDGTVSHVSKSTRIVELDVRIMSSGVCIAEGSAHARVRE